MLVAMNIKDAVKVSKLRRLRKAGPQKYPKLLDRRYQKTLEAIMTRMYQIAIMEIRPRYESLRRSRQAVLPAAIREDDWSNETEILFESIRDSFSSNLSRDQIKALSLRTGIPVSEWQRRELLGQVKRVTGVEILLSEPWLESELSSWSINNANLVTNMVEDSVKRIQTTTFNAVSQGIRSEDLEENLMEDLGVSKSRARLIARDQVSKLTGNLNELRQSEIGITEYTWRTSNDDRVRQSHARKEGNVYSWDKPPADTGHPSDEVNCRCWAEPIIDFEA